MPFTNEESFFPDLLYEFQFNPPLNSDIEKVTLHTYVYCYSSVGPLEVDIEPAAVEHMYGTCFFCCLLSVVAIPAITRQMFKHWEASLSNLQLIV